MRDLVPGTARHVRITHGNTTLLSARGRWVRSVFLVAFTSLPLLLSPPSQAESNNPHTLLETHCLDCHQGSSAEGEFDLESIVGQLKGNQGSVSGNRRRWARVLARVSAGEMPPVDAEAFAAQERKQIEQFVEELLVQPTTVAVIGPSRPRRLNRFEYSTTIRDLMNIHVDAGQGLPIDGAGGEGFDNAAETLFLSSVHLEKYIQAAEDVASYVARDATARSQLLAPAEEQEDSAAARRVLDAFLEKAFRRPLIESERDRFAAFFDSRRKAGSGFEEAILECVQAALISPSFLFLTENQSSETDIPDGHALACRLSYFIWSSLPDSELIELAEQGKLTDPSIIEQQIDRMLEVSEGSRRSEVPKSRALAENFMGQWLGTRDLGSRFIPDPAAFPEYDQELEFGLRFEPVYFLEHMLVENRSLLELLDADYTFMNRNVAEHYGLLDKIKLRGFGQMKKVDLPDDSRRGGVTTMGAVLAVSSYPHRTSPVLRGKWLLDTLFDVTLPPPPDVPSLDQVDRGDKEKPLTTRAKLEIHRRDSQCASCHDRLDPLGFSLDHFDAIGRWREAYEGQPVDSRGELPGGKIIDGSDSLKQILLERKEEFVRGLIARMLGYALGRGLIDDDFATVEKIHQRLKANDYAIRELIKGIATSDQFQAPAAQLRTGQ